MAKSFVEHGAREVEGRLAMDALFLHGGEVDTDGEDVGVGGEAGGTDGFGAGEVCFGGGDGALGGFEELFGEGDAVIGTGDLCDEIHAGVALLFGGEFFAQLGGLDVGTGAAEVIEDLVHRELGLEVVDGARVIEGVNGEVGGGETALREEGGEGEDGIIGGLKGLGVVDFREEAGAGLGGAGRDSLRLSVSRLDGRVLVESLLDGFAQG